MDYHEFKEMCEKAEKMFEKHLKVVLEELEKNPKPNKEAIEMILDGLEFIEMNMRRRQRGGNDRGRDDDDRGRDRYRDQDRGGWDRQQQGGYGQRGGMGNWGNNMNQGGNFGNWM